MPAPISPDIKLADCVFSYSEAAKQSEGEFLRLWRMAFRGFKRMGINAFWQCKTVELDVDQDAKFADFPDDYLQWIKVGQFNSLGELQTIAVNEQLTTFHGDMPDRLAAIVPEIQDCRSALLSDSWFNGNGFYSADIGNGRSQAFGLGSRLIQAGECIIDTKAKVIILNTDYQYQFVIFEYLSIPEMDADYCIPMQFEEAMIDWLSWQDIKHIPVNSHVAANDRRAKALQFKASLQQAKREYKPFRLQEAAQITVEAQVLGIKP